MSPSSGRRLLIHAKSQDRSSATYPEGPNWCRHGGGTMKAALQNYQARMRRVLDYIDRHLDSDLDLETVSGVRASRSFISTGSLRQPSGYPCIAMSSLPV